MTSEDDLTSDSLDVSVRDVPEFLLKELKTRVIQYIAETDEFSAQIHHIHGQFAKLVFSLGTKQVQPTRATSKVADANHTNTTCTLVVKNVPSSADEDLLEVFFESKKKQGGGPVKSVKLFSEKRFAFVEFEEPEAVQTVMNKRPIKFGQTTLDIQPYSPLLRGNETVGSLDVKGLPKKLTEDILEMHLDGIIKPEVPTYGTDLAAMLKVGSRVVRGKDWESSYGNWDHNGKGTITGIGNGYADVRWDYDNSTCGVYNGRYRMGKDGCYDLMLTS